jgi:hypothetical protein
MQMWQLNVVTSPWGFEVELRLRSAEQVGRNFKFRLERSGLILRAPFFV